MSFVFFPGMIVFLVIAVLFIIGITYVIYKTRQMFHRVSNLERIVYEHANRSSDPSYKMHQEQAFKKEDQRRDSE